MTSTTTLTQAYTTPVRLTTLKRPISPPPCDPLADLPSLSTLRTWVQRPQASATCWVSDIYRMKALVPSANENTTYSTRDVFMLDRFPCRMVEVVGWVAGVDHKEASMTVTLDDGDGEHVLPVTIRLPTERSAPTATARIPATLSIDTPNVSISTSTFTSARERKLQRKAAVIAEAAQIPISRQPKLYLRKDIRVGDTVRIIGKIDEWARKRASGESDWVRQLVVEEGSGGSITVVDPDEAIEHNHRVVQLHKSLYCRPFVVPPTPLLPSRGGSQASSPAKSMAMSEGTTLSSELGSESMMSVNNANIRLRDPSKLRSSQLTDSTFRQYLLDYITQETIRCLDAAGSDATLVLKDLFPEYAQLVDKKGKSRAPFGESPLSNCHPQTFPSRQRASYPSTRMRSFKHDLDPFTVTSLLDVPHLNELARLVVDSEAKKDERRRRRRINEGCPRPRDLEIELDRQSKGLSTGHWKLSETERRGKMDKLVGWVIRGLAEEGGLVQLALPPLRPRSASKGYDKAEKKEFGYLPLPPQLLLPLLLPIIEAERDMRSRLFLKKEDMRRDNGMTVEELILKLQSWGTDGRWERIREWVVSDAMKWGCERGYLRSAGRGWWVEDP